jgi:hypothetical protein
MEAGPGSSYNRNFMQNIIGTAMSSRMDNMVRLNGETSSLSIAGHIS